MLIARVKKDLVNLFKHIEFTNHNKYWRKLKKSYSLPRWHYEELAKALKKEAICHDTMDYLKDINMYGGNIFIHIYSCPDYSDFEKEEILEKYKADIDWYLIYQMGLTFDLKVKYYKEIRHSFINKHHGNDKVANEWFKDIEREYKIKFLLDEANS